MKYCGEKCNIKANEARRINIKTIISLLYMSSLLVLLINPNILLLLTNRMFIGVMTILNPVVGMSFYIISAFLDPYLEMKMNFSTPIITISSNVVFIAGYTINSLSSNVRLKIKREYLNFALGMFSFIIISFLFNYNREVISSYMVLSVNIISFMYLGSIIAKGIGHEKIAFNAIYISGVIIVILGFLMNDQTSIRFSLGGNIRNVSNIVGLSTVIIAGCIFSEKFKKGDGLYFFTKSKLINFLATLPLLIALVSTISRGVLLATIISIIVMYLLTNKWRETIKLPRKKVFYATMVLVLGGIGLYFYTINNPSFLYRFTQSPTENVRLEFWNTAINQMNSYEWLVGVGVGGFRDLALWGKYDFYAHSVYIDTLVSIGIGGFTFLIVTMLSIGNKLIRKRNIIGVGILTYLFMAFSTHGHVNSRSFWIFLAIIYGMTINKGRGV